MLLKVRVKNAIEKYREDGNWEELKPVLEILIDFKLGQKGFSGQYGEPELARENALYELALFFGNPEWRECKNIWGEVIKIINGVAKAKNPVMAVFDERYMAPSAEDVFIEKEERGPAPDELTREEADDIAQAFRILKPAALAREGGPWDYMRLKSVKHFLWQLLGIFGKARKVNPQNIDDVQDEFAAFCDLIGKREKRGIVFPSVKAYQDATARYIIRNHMSLTAPQLAEMIKGKCGYEYQSRQIRDFKEQELKREEPSVEDDFEGLQEISKNYTLLVKRRRGK